MALVMLRQRAVPVFVDRAAGREPVERVGRDEFVRPLVRQCVGECPARAGYGLEASVTPADGPVRLVRLRNTSADATESSIRTSVGGADNVFSTLEIACLEAGEAEVKLAAETLELYDEVTIHVLCEGGDEPDGGDSDAKTTDCEPFNSDINVGSINQVGQAAADTGLVPEDVRARAVGQELRRMMEVTGEVCQHELLALTSGGEITPEIEGAILIAVLRVQRESE